MTASIIAALAAMLGGIAIAGSTYWFTKKREREAEWRKEKLEHYKSFVLALSGTTPRESTPESQKAYILICNNLNLIAPQAVIEALQEFIEETKISNLNKNQERHDKLLAALFYEIRKDMKISPRDDSKTFSIGLYTSGRPALK